MPIDGLTKTQSDFIEKYLKAPKIGGRKKKARREEATREFRRFNVNREAVARRVEELGDPAVKLLLRGELARAETLIGTDASDLHFDDAMAQLAAVNTAVADHKRQAAVKEKHALMLARMAEVEDGTPLDNIDDITRLWTFADTTFESGIRSNDPARIGDAERALDQLPALINAGRTDITGEGRESKARLRAVGERLAKAEETAAVVFDAKHVPPALTTLFRTVHDRLSDGAGADVAALPAAATAAETAMDGADTAAEALYAARRTWNADHARFRLRYDLMDGHALASDATHVKPKFDAVRTAYKAAGDHALAHDYARATAALAPLFAQVDTALTFADDCQNFLAIHDRRKAMADDLPAADTRRYDQVKQAITDTRNLLAEAGTERDNGNMGAALRKLTDVAPAAARAAKLVRAEEEFVDLWQEITAIRDGLNNGPAELKALFDTEITHLTDELDASVADADGGNVDAASARLSGLYGFALSLTKRSPEEIAENEPPRRNEEAEAYLAEKASFLVRLGEANAITDPDGRIAVADYIAEMNEAKTRMDKWEAEGSFYAATALAKQLKGEHADRLDDAAEAKTYLAAKTDVDAKVATLEAGGAGTAAAAETLAMAKQMVTDAIAISQKDDWFQAARMMEAALDIVTAAEEIRKNDEIASNMVNSAVLANIGTDFDAAQAEFDRLHGQVANLDSGNLFQKRLADAATAAKQARNALPADPGRARAELEGAIAETRDVLVLIVQADTYDIQRQTIEDALKAIRKEDKDNLVKPEINAITGHLSAAKQAAKTLDFRTALDEMAQAQTEVKTAYGTTPYIGYYRDELKTLKKLRAKFSGASMAPGLTAEIARFDTLVSDVETAFRDRRMGEMMNLARQAAELGRAYVTLGSNYVYAVKARDAVKARIVPALQHPAAKDHMDKANAEIAEVDRAMSDRLYTMAVRMARRAQWPIDSAEEAIKAFDALTPIKSAAITALRDLEDRDDTANAMAHERILALRAEFDAALDKENMKNYGGAARLLTGFPERCDAVKPLLDAFDLYTAAREEAQKAITALTDKGADPIQPMVDRIEKKRDNALRLAGKQDFATARDLLTELLEDCRTAEQTLARQAEFDRVTAEIKAVDDGDTAGLTAAIASATDTLKQLRARPAALFLVPELEAVDDALDKARADADSDFDGALALVTGAVDDCGRLAGEMGRFDQFTDSVALAGRLATDLLDTHPQADFARDEIQALASRVDSRMTAVRADPARRSAARDDIEKAIATLRDLRHLLDAHQAWHVEMRTAETDLQLLEADPDRRQIGADVRACRQKLDDAAAKATGRDHAGAMKDIAGARDLMAKARLRLKACNNQAPDRKELEALLAAPGGDAMLDDVINGLDEETQRKVMTVAFEARFGCKLDVFASPKDFEKGRADTDLGKKAPNLQRFFKLMSDLPASATRDNDSMLTFSHVGTEATGSYYAPSAKEVAMREGEAAKSGTYGVGLEHELGVDPATLELQEGESIDFFSWNTLHEVGHAVDDKLGFMDRNGESLAGWKVYGTNVRPVAEAIAAELGFDSGYLAEYISQGKGSAPPVPDPAGCSPEEWERRRREACAWIDRVRVDKQPWAMDSTAKNAKTAAGKVFHESYANSWCSYDYAARAKGVSGYQFRAPGEWFSELYAAVHTRKLKPSHTHYNIIANAQ